MSKDQADPVGWPTISVITAAFAMERWDGLRQAVASIQAQTVTVLETIVVIDHNPDLLDRARRELPGVVVVPNLRNRGASGARNSGVAASRGEVVAFLDDDAVAVAREPVAGPTRMRRQTARSAGTLRRARRHQSAWGTTQLNSSNVQYSGA